jgi:hypothetical protein
MDGEEEIDQRAEEGEAGLSPLRVTLFCIYERRRGPHVGHQAQCHDQITVKTMRNGRARQPYSDDRRGHESKARMSNM